MRTIATDVTVAWCVCLHPAKVAAGIEVLFGMETAKGIRRRGSRFPNGFDAVFAKLLGHLLIC